MQAGVMEKEKLERAIDLTKPDSIRWPQKQHGVSTSIICSPHFRVMRIGLSKGTLYHAVQRVEHSEHGDVADEQKKACGITNDVV